MAESTVKKATTSGCMSFLSGELPFSPKAMQMQLTKEQQIEQNCDDADCFKPISYESGTAKMAREKHKM